MPAGPAGLGFVYFATVKYLGYTAFCHWAIEPRARRAFPDSKPPYYWGAGAIRTLLGVSIGVVVGLSFWNIPYFSDHGSLPTLLFFSLLLPVRIFEWWLLLKLCYGSYRSKGIITWGIVTSFALDLLGMLTAMIMPGGMWVC